ncbi:MAG TPA: tRNA (adenosine(37)-N6)-dimethylallyltransferase MiaA [Polyangia bacterium]
MTAHRVLALVGPTASGKSALALRLASLLPIEIVSCDSLMVYIGMDIGTGKPTVAEQRSVPHHVLDVVAPNEPFHAARWAQLARAAIRDIAGRGKLPMIVGGTGLYLRALLGGLFEAPPPDEAIRQRHRDEATRDGSPALHARLAALDPETAARVDPRDLMRISRALEIFEQTGEPISVLQKRGSPAGDVVCQTIVLAPPLERLRPAIAARFDSMLAAGLVDETRRLRDTFGADPRPLQALGYRQVGDFLAGVLPLDAAVVAAKAATAAYARRQRTFFRKLPAAWRPEEVPEPAAVLAWWQAQAATS